MHWGQHGRVIALYQCPVYTVSLYTFCISERKKSVVSSAKLNEKQGWRWWVWSSSFQFLYKHIQCTSFVMNIVEFSSWTCIFPLTFSYMDSLSFCKVLTRWQNVKTCMWLESNSRFRLPLHSQWQCVCFRINVRWIFCSGIWHYTWVFIIVEVLGGNVEECVVNHFLFVRDIFPYYLWIFTLRNLNPHK